MKVIIFAMMFLFIAGCSNQKIESGVLEQRSAPKHSDNNQYMPQLVLKSPAFENDKNIPSKYTCDGEDINPPLEWDNIPEGAKSLVLIVDDPDAPSGNWDHWLVWNIDPSVKSIQEGEVPEGAVLGMNDFNKTEWGGPCPPSGVHRYQFKLYALDTILNIPSGSRKSELEEAMKGHILDQSVLVGLYSRN